MECLQVRQNLDQCTIDDKRLALDVLDIKVIATPDRIEVQGVIPMDLVTIEQTSGWLISCTWDYTSGEEAVSIITTNANKPI